LHIVYSLFVVPEIWESRVQQAVDDCRGRSQEAE
jgi:hypothetical protein